jgi:hypothetical protein
MNSNDPVDGAERREKAVAEGAELRERAVEHARKVGDALGLNEAPSSPDPPPPYPAPRVSAPPYPRRSLKETLPSTPRAIARQVAESLAPLTPLTPETAPAVPSPVAPPASSTHTSTANEEPPPASDLKT